MNDIFGLVWEHSENNYGKCVGVRPHRLQMCGLPSFCVRCFYYYKTYTADKVSDYVPL